MYLPHQISSKFYHLDVINICHYELRHGTQFPVIFLVFSIEKKLEEKEERRIDQEKN